jgi:2,4-diketo-3-deoxy-L-fuconate hydrolase
MKILRFGSDRVGVIKNENSVVDVTDVIKGAGTVGAQAVMEELIGNFDGYRSQIEGLVGSEAGVPLDGVTLLPTIPRPSRVLAAFSNYLDGLNTNRADVPEEFFYKDPDVVGPEGDVHLSDLPGVMVHHPEAELAYIIKKGGRNISAADAMDHVFGHTGFFDISAQGLTRRSQLIPKGQASYVVAGPWITTSDEIPDPHNIQVKSWVNGEARQDYSTEHMAVMIPDQIAWLSRFVDLHPGNIVATGTFHVGLGPLNDGGVAELEVQGVGRIRVFAHGGGAPRMADFRPGVTQVERPAGGMSRV